MIIDSTLNTGSLQQLIESTGRRAVLKGMGGACTKGITVNVLIVQLPKKGQLLEINNVVS